MKFNVTAIPPDVVQPSVQVGNVYPAQGNRLTREQLDVINAVYDEARNHGDSRRVRSKAKP